MRTTSRPLMNPTTTASAKASRIDAQSGKPYCMVGMAMTTPEKAIIEPTERSNSPAIISSAATPASRPSWAETSRKLRMPLALNIPLLPATAKKKM